MKTFLVVVCLAVAAVSAQEGKGKRGPPGGPKGEWKGCNVTRPEGVDKKDCCPGIPRSLSCLAKDACKTQCPKKEGEFPDMCCYSECALRNYTKDGKLDVDSIVNALVAQITDNTDQWKGALTTIVSGCIASAPSDLQKLKDKVAAAKANATAKGNGTEGKHGKPGGCFFGKILNCSNAVAIVTEHCIKKKIFLDCPTRSTTDQCNQLYKHAEACPQFFFEHGKGKGSEERKNEKQSEQKKNGPSKDQGKGPHQGKEQGKSNSKNQEQRKGNPNGNKPSDNKNQGKQQQKN